MNQTDLTPFFGYGLLADDVFAGELFDRFSRPTEIEVAASGYKLVIVPKDEINSEAVRTDPKIPDNYKIYGLTPTGNEDDLVKGRLLYLSRRELGLVDMLDFGNNVFKTETVMYLGGVPIRSHVLRKPEIGIPVENGLRYNPYLNGDGLDAFDLAFELEEKYDLMHPRAAREHQQLRRTKER